MSGWDEVNGRNIMMDHVLISDRPAYTHRGISLDTVRNFISLDKIKQVGFNDRKKAFEELRIIFQVIDSLSYSKMNVFHWHISDSQSFPLQLPTLPDFSRFGAYTPESIYTEEDIKELVDYADDRGVRIIPELDAPAHVGAGWETVDPDYTVCRDADPWETSCVQPPCGQLNPSKDGIYEVLQMIFKDMLTMFRPTSFHMGGDEIHVGCWNSTQMITDWLVEQGRGLNEDDFIWMWSQYQNKSYEKLVNASKTAGLTNVPEVILWNSHLTNKEYINYLVG